MGFLRNLLGPQRPTISRDDIPNADKMLHFIRWFIEHEQYVTALSNPGCNAIFAEGYRPYASEFDNPDLVPDLEVTSLQQWFMLKVYIDLTFLKDASKEQFAESIEMLEADTTERLSEITRIAKQYDLQLEPFLWRRETAKITDENHLEVFKVYYLQDTVVGAEIRILAWVYRLFFGEWFKDPSQSRF